MADFTPRATIYRGIKMRSRLEAGFAAWLDRAGLTWSYEPRAFGSPQGQYLPDFCVDPLQVVGVGAARCYIEVKPRGWLDRGNAGEAVEALVASFKVLWDSEPHAMVVLQCEGTQPRFFADGSEGPSGTCPHILIGRWVVGGETVALAFDAPGPWPDGYWRASSEPAARTSAYHAAYADF